jgi:2-haloalkanoic acid dehalogenase type II
MLHSAASLTLVGEFRPFRAIGETTLRSTLAQLGVDPGRAEEVLQELGELDAYPEAGEAFDLLDEAGVPAVTLTNGGREHTEKLLESAGLRQRVQRVFTVDEVEAYKPHREPYLYAARTLGLPPASLALIAAHGGTSSGHALQDWPRSGSTGSSGAGRSRRTCHRRRAISSRRSSWRSPARGNTSSRAYADGHQNAPKLSGPVCAPTAAPTR